jgi:7-cyano-7-deazaguanine synthase
MTHVVALVSGGVDSFVLVQRLLTRGATVWPLYVRCGLRWEAAELASLRRWLAPLRRPRLKPLCVVELPVHSLYRKRHWSMSGRRVPSSASADAAVYLPGRNVLLLGEAAIYAERLGISRLAVGTLKGNPFGDATPEFFRRYAQALDLALTRRIAIEAPLRHLTKAQLIAAHSDWTYHMTFSCIAPRGRRHCGRCNKCAERRRAFRAAHLPDPTAYASS